MKANKFIGDKKFYRMVLIVAIPIMIQNGITNFVSMLDNILVGQIGTEQMSGVAIVNQLMFVFNICIFGAISGAGIFGAQFYGNGNHEGVRNAFRFKLIVCGVMALIGIGAFLNFGPQLISQFLHDGGEVGDIGQTLFYGREYLRVMLLGMIPFAIMQAYASTLRETGETLLPMKAGITAVFVNLIFNYILIFGKFGAPTLGVKGAAIATVISRIIECLIVVIWTHRHKEKNKFIVEVYRHFRIPRHLVNQIVLKGFPLMLNEAFWSAGMAIMTQCYSVRGLAVVAGINISSTISNVFNIVFIALGSSVAIIVGQLLGADKKEEAKDTDTKLIFFSVVSCIFIGILLMLIAPVFPLIYNTTEEVRSLATDFIKIVALCMPLHAFNHASYFTLRSGGKTIVTFLFDSVFTWVVSIPTAFLLTRYTDLHIVMVYFICQSLELIKCFIGFTLVKKGIWIQNIVETKRI